MVTETYRVQIYLITLPDSIPFGYKICPKNGIMTRSHQIKVKDMAYWTESVAKQSF